MRRRGALVGAAIAVASCGGGQTSGRAFDPLWSNDDGAGVTAFRERFAGAVVPVGADVAVGVEAGGQAIVGATLDGKGAPWRFEHALSARPSVAGSVVVGAGGGEVFALEASTGQVLWRRPAQGKLRGVGDDGKTTLVSLEPVSGRGSTLLAVTRDGAVVRQIEDDERIGTPAVVEGFAFLPWKGQYVTIYDLVRGREAARVLLRQQTSRAFASGGALFFGEITATRFDDAVKLGAANHATTVTLPARELAGPPKWMTSGDDPRPLVADAEDKVHLFARPATSGPAAVVADRFAATYYRVVLGLDSRSGALSWARVVDADVLAGAAPERGFALCLADGRVVVLDATTGGVAREVSLGKPLDACAVQADGLAVPRAAGGEPLVDALASIVLLPGAELVAAQRVLLRELAALPDDRATRALVDVAAAGRAAPLLRADAEALLAKRASGAGVMLEALAWRYDFLADKPSSRPPVGALADALAALGEARAAALLAAHLLDPDAPLADVERVAAALATLATKAELPALTTFHALNRGTVDDEALANALVSVTRALVRLGARDVVRDAMGDPFTAPIVKARLAPLVGLPVAPPR